MSVSCSVSQTTLFRDTNARKYFKNDEINDLVAVLNTFDSIMVGTNQLSDAVISIYQDRIKWTIDQAANSGNCCEFLIPSSLAIEILNSIPERTFSKLFKILRVSDRTRTTVYFWPRTIDEKSSYRQLVSEITNPGLNLYLQNISQAGDLNLNLTYQFYEQIDLNDAKQRLLMAIDLIAFTARNHVNKDVLVDLAMKKQSLDEVQH